MLCIYTFYTITAVVSEWSASRHSVSGGELLGDCSPAWNPSTECVSVPSQLCSKEDIQKLGKAGRRTRGQSPWLRKKSNVSSDKNEVCADQWWERGVWNASLCLKNISISETLLVPRSKDVQNHRLLRLDCFHCSGKTSLPACLCCFILPLRHMLLATIRDKMLNNIDSACNLGQML